MKLHVPPADGHSAEGDLECLKKLPLTIKGREIFLQSRSWKKKKLFLVRSLAASEELHSVIMI